MLHHPEASLQVVSLFLPLSAQKVGELLFRMAQTRLEVGGIVTQQCSHCWVGGWGPSDRLPGRCPPGELRFAPLPCSWFLSIIHCDRCAVVGAGLSEMRGLHPEGLGVPSAPWTP